MVEDDAGNIWFGTGDGLCRYDGRNFSAVPIPTAISDLDPLPATNAVTSMLRDKSGKLWFGTSEGVYCCSGTSLARFLADDSIVTNSGLSLKDLQCMLQDRNDTIWFGSGPMAFEGLCRYDGKALTSFKPGGEQWIRSLLEDRQGTLWLGTRHQGAWRYDGKTFSRFREEEGIGAPLLMDKEGNIWFGGGEHFNGYGEGGGIWRYDGKALTNFTAKDGLGDYSVWCMVADKSGNIWVGTRNVGLYRYDGNRFECFSE
jgi:ligand-binding sensor domain-containing protein